MPVNPADQPATGGVLRRRGMKRLSAVTAGVGVAGVLATGAIAITLPGSAHDTGSTSGATSSSGSGGSATSQKTSESSSGATSSVSSTTSGSSNGTDATSGAS